MPRGPSPPLREFDGATPPTEGGVEDGGSCHTVRMGVGVVSRKQVDGVARVVARAASGDELFESLAAEIGKAIPYDGSLWFGVDPTTMLAVGPGRTENLGEA